MAESIINLCVSIFMNLARQFINVEVVITDSVNIIIHLSARKCIAMKGDSNIDLIMNVTYCFSFVKFAFILDVCFG